VTEYAAGLHIRAALVHMKIGTTDIGVRDLDESVRRLLDLRVRHVLYTDIPRSVIDKCSHDFPHVIFVREIRVAVNRRRKT
jgi:hypothetical protein